MDNQAVNIKKYTEPYKPELLQVWESSVLSTHDFLSRQDFEAIKAVLNSLDFTLLNVFCLFVGQNMAGFIGISDRKIEMLFLSPDYIGKGLGKTLMNFAIDNLHIDKVDVNEQNTNAVNFYRKYGFETYERTEKDDMGMSYPILKMKLKKS